MIKIDKKYLTKIIKEETAKANNPINEQAAQAAQAAKAAWTALPPEVKAMIVQYVVEKGPKTLDAAFEKIKDTWKNRGASGGSSMSDDDLMDYSQPCPQGWKDADCLQNKINTILKGALEGLGERYGLEADQEQQLISDFMYDIEGPLLDLTLATVGGAEDTQGEGDELDMTARFDKKGPRNFGTHDLMGDNDADLMEKKKMKISQKQLAKIIQEEISRMLGEEKHGKGCAESEGGSGCIKYTEQDGWHILNNKKGGIFKRCKSKKDCEEILSVPGVHQ